MKKILLPIVILSFFGYGADVKSYHIGEIEFISLKDKETNMGKAILLEPSARVVGQMMPDDQNPSSINTFIVKTVDSIVLIDTGYGGGKLSANLKSINITNADIDTVLLTHMHGDHIGGLTLNGERAFKSAKVLVSKKELEYWLSLAPKSAANRELVQKIIEIYGKDIQTFEWDTFVTPQIKALNAAGHTPGHTAFEIISFVPNEANISKQITDRVLIAGDIIHSLKVQLTEPKMSVTFDVDPKEAAATRARVFKEASAQKIKIAGMHIPFSGIGYIVDKGNGSYVFEELR
ncbi:MAG: MBL fold metallo-hydrolase [Campylobacteraceae bacterium]|nr:MBL fold metallo-hydrolase [Campylobacteraceae bacterium]